MPRILILMVVFLPALSWPTAASDQVASAPRTAAETVAIFFSELADGNVDSAMSMTASVKGIPDQAVRSEYDRLSEYLKRTGAPRVVAHLQFNQAAVVIFRDNTPGEEQIVDLDPAYLVRREGRWLVSYELTRFDRPYHDFDEDTLACLRQVQEWYGAQKPALQGLLKREDAR